MSLSASQKEEIGGKLKHIGTVRTFFQSILDGLEKAGALEAVEKALPWAEHIGAALPPVKFFLSLGKELVAIKDPEVLAYLACTAAYEQAVLDALKTADEPANRPDITATLAVQLGDLEKEASQAGEGVDFSILSLSNPVTHPFVTEADAIQRLVLEKLGFDDDQVRRIITTTHHRFSYHLHRVLAHGDTRDKFAPLREYLASSAGEDRTARLTLVDHAEYQRWLFDEHPLFGQEPFTLRKVYIHTDCGVLKWGETENTQQHGASQEGRVDPFSEKHGGRQDLRETVLGLMGDPEFQDAIVIQGVAGAGKSAFTLWLSAELVRRGLQPIRIRLRDVPQERERTLLEVLARGVRVGEDKAAPNPDRLFLDGSIFDETTRFGKAEISSYVLILDGWDEITIGANEGYSQRIEWMLERLRNFLKERRSAPVRVILTGRPSHEVNRSNFLQAETPLLTLRPLTPDQLQGFVTDLAEHVKSAPAEDKEEGDVWKPFNPSRFDGVIKQYKDDFEKNGAGRLEVLGLPLLAHLAVRLFVQTDEDPQTLLQDRTTLYRRLTDLTCAKGGKANIAEEPVESQPRILKELRRLLWGTAAAMTVYGKEHISHDELQLRLDELGFAHDEKLAALVERITAERVLSRLMISYYFKVGRTDQGGEFVHKSFREYLFAEGLVEQLKQFGRSHSEPLPEKPSDKYWKDFDEDDPRYDLSRQLARRLAPQWFSNEVLGFLRSLLAWEITRSTTEGDEDPEATPPLDLEGWERVRDGLADLWDWWGEGVHLRAPVYMDRREPKYDKRPFVADLAEWAIPLDRQRGWFVTPPPRTTTMDAHLGDALFHVAATVHSRLSIAKGWSEDVKWSMGGPPAAEGTRRYQAQVKDGNNMFTLFAPSGEGSTYFSLYISRVNAAGWHPRLPFPYEVDLGGVNLRGVDFSGVDLRGAYLEGAYLERAMLTDANLETAYLKKAKLFRASLHRANLIGANLEEAELVAADLEEANLTEALLLNADLERANLFRADLRGAFLENAYLVGADLKEVNLFRARLLKTELVRADLKGANLIGAEIDENALLHVRSLYNAHLDPDLVDFVREHKPSLLERPS